jgi:amino-acid N-acetyltransferase
MIIIHQIEEDPTDIRQACEGLLWVRTPPPWCRVAHGGELRVVIRCGVAVRKELGQLVIRQATETDVVAIHTALIANAADPPLQQPEDRIRRNLGDFVVVIENSKLVGCAALHRHSATNAEVRGVAVDPVARGHGIGAILMKACMTRATEAGVKLLWLATAKPDDFGRYGFRRMSRWRLPLRVVLRTLRRVFEQPVRRWLPTLLGRRTFMRLEA